MTRFGHAGLIPGARGRGGSRPARPRAGRGSRDRPQRAVERRRERAGGRARRRVPSASCCSPSTDAVRRRSSRTGVLSRRCATLSAKQAGRDARRPGRRGAPSAFDPEAGERRERAPRGGEPEVACGSGRRRARGCRRARGRRRRATKATRSSETRHGAGDADRDRAGEPDDGERDERAVGQPRAERAARAARRARARATPTARKKAASAATRRSAWSVGRRRGAERDVAEVPRRVRRVQERDEVAPAARAQRVERRALSRRACRRHRVPHITTPAAEAHPPHAATAPIPAARHSSASCGERVARVEAVDARPEEAPDLVPLARRRARPSAGSPTRV